jgi:tol-pal system protein YbgF
MNGHINRMKKTMAQRILPLCLCCLVGAGAFAAPAMAQSKDLVNRISRLENELETLNRAVYKGENPPAGMMGNNGGAAMPDDLLERLQRMESEIRDLTGKVEQQSYDMQQIQQRLEALTQDSGMRLDSIEAQLRNAPAPQAAVPQTAPNVIGGAPPQPIATPADMSSGGVIAVDPSMMVTGQENGLSTTDATGLYEQGFAQIKAQDYPAAENTFSTFIKQYPDHALTGNAYYWLGETHYVRKDYDKSSRVFAESYKKFPNGSKGADNLLKLGMSLAGQGKKDDACIALGQLRKKYPNGPAPVMNKADQERATLGCS